MRTTEKTMGEFLAEIRAEFGHVSEGIGVIHSRIAKVESTSETIAQKQLQQQEFDQRITRLEERLKAAIEENTRRVDSTRFTTNMLVTILGGGILVYLAQHLH